MMFDPFNDRMARDIRNSLSSALVAELTKAGDSTISAVAQEWLEKKPGEIYRHYIETQCRQYRHVLERVRTERIETPRRQAIVLWNAGLLFELHELLETIWQGAREPDRTGLKGVIQAAGAYVHGARGKAEASHKLAIKARANLSKGASALAFIENLDQLIDALAQTPPKPVRLVYLEIE